MGSAPRIIVMHSSDNVGVVVPDGRADMAALRIKELASDGVEQARIAARAHAASKRAGNNLEAMVQGYLALFRREMARASAYM